MVTNESEAVERAPVLVAGGSGFLGTAIVRALASAGWVARGLTRSDQGADRVRGAGGVPMRGDLLDLPTLLDATRGCGAIIHVASSSGLSDDPEEPRRVRVEGTQNLVQAAHRNGVRKLLLGSGYWVYAGQPTLLTEESPVAPAGESKVNFEAEETALGANARGTLEVMVVRPGMVYGNGSWLRPIVDDVEGGRYRLINGGSNRWSFVALADAGRGFEVVLRRGVSGSRYNLVDDAPAPWGEFVRFVASELGRPAPRSIPLALAEEEYGTIVAHHLAADRAASAARLRALGWTPEFLSYRTGIPPVLRSMAHGPRREPSGAFPP